MSVIELEMGEARKPHKCACCGTAIESTHGFIYRNNEAFAVYQAAWCEGHPENQVNTRIEVGGDWGEPDNRPEHVFFGVLIFCSSERVSFSILEPSESMWPGDEPSARFLTRETALAHPLKTEIFHVAEHIASGDTRVKAFLANHVVDA